MERSSITVKLPDGSSKVIYFPAAPITEATTASQQALTPGKSVVVVNSINSDDSITASTVQIRSTLR